MTIETVFLIYVAAIALFLAYVAARILYDVFLDLRDILKSKRSK